MRARNSGEILKAVVGVFGEATDLLRGRSDWQVTLQCIRKSMKRARDTPQRSRMTSSSKDRDNLA
jgi:hypothetical protein